MAKICFFISRIGEAGSPEREFSDKLLKYIVAPVLQKCGYGTPVRADHITQPGVITTQVFQHLWNDDLVVADLTGGNPNVFYELAVRHVRRKPFVHLIQAGHRIPFDIAPNRTIEFDFDIEKAERAKATLEAMVDGALDAPASLLTPLSAAIDFSTAETSPDPIREGIAQLLSMVQEIKGAVRGPMELAFSAPWKLFSPGTVTLRKSGNGYQASSFDTAYGFHGAAEFSRWLAEHGLETEAINQVLASLEAGQALRVRLRSRDEEQ